MIKKKKFQEGGTYNPWTGIDTSGRTGGYDQYGQGIAAMIPGGGALAGIGQIAGGVADIMASKKEIERQRRLKQKAADEARKSRSALDAFEFDVSQAQRDLATAGIRPTDTSYIQSGLATSLGAMQDPRAFGAASGLLGQSLEAERKAKEADMQRELSAMRGLAGLEQSALEKKQGLQLDLQKQDYAIALQDRSDAQANIEAAKAAKRDAMGNIVSGAISTALPFFGGLGQDAVKNLTGQTERQLKKNIGDPIEDDYVEDDSEGGFGKNGMRIKYNEGGVVEEILRRQPVQKTEGEFNHDTNKKAIVDEETGEKEGEATGGEYILNPEQGEEIHMAYKGVEQIVESGEEPTMEQLMALYEAVRGVFSQPQFNEA
jgi:hypothetical protein